MEPSDEVLAFHSLPGPMTAGDGSDEALAALPDDMDTPGADRARAGTARVHRIVDAWRGHRDQRRFRVAYPGRAAHAEPDPGARRSAAAARAPAVVAPGWRLPSFRLAVARDASRQAHSGTRPLGFRGMVQSAVFRGPCVVRGLAARRVAVVLVDAQLDEGWQAATGGRLRRRSTCRGTGSSSPPMPGFIAAKAARTRTDSGSSRATSAACGSSRATCSRTSPH